MVDRDILIEYFSQFGEVSNAYVIYDPKTQSSKSKNFPHLEFGYVEFEDQECANYVLETKEHFIKGKKIILKQFKPKEDTQTQGKQEKKKEEKRTRQDLPAFICSENGKKSDFVVKSNNQCTTGAVLKNLYSSPNSGNFKEDLYEKNTTSKLEKMEKACDNKKRANIPPIVHERKCSEFYKNLRKRSVLRDEFENQLQLPNLRFNFRSGLFVGSFRN